MSFPTITSGFAFIVVSAMNNILLNSSRHTKTKMGVLGVFEGNIVMFKKFVSALLSFMTCVLYSTISFSLNESNG